jgi:hypothetical protein
VASEQPLLFAFNHGEVSTSALGRIDQEKLKLAAQTQINWTPSVLGPMSLRPGTEYLGSTYNDAPARFVPFVFGVHEKAKIELTDSIMRVWVDDALVTAPQVSTTIPNGDFSSSGGWTTTATAGALASISAGVLTLHANTLGSSSYCERAIPVIGQDIGVVHRLRIIVNRGDVTFQIGATSGGEEYFSATTLKPGAHSIAFTPTSATFYPRLSTLTSISKVVDSITIETNGVVTLPTPWTADDLSLIDYEQSGDIVYVACEGFQQREIQRRDNQSWSVVLYETTGGPYTAKPSFTDQIALLPNQSSGGTQDIAATHNLFTNDYLNSLITIDMDGQNYGQQLGAVNLYTQPIEVNGADTVDRAFVYTITGTWVGTLSLQRSTTGADTGFTEVSNTAANVSIAVDDSATHPNITAWYRFGFTAYTSGYATVGFTYGGGGGRGEGRIISVNSPTSANIEITNLFEGYYPGYKWRTGEWSPGYGWPSAVTIHDGRLFWFGRDKVWGSISDDYINFDETNVTAAGPINRSFGSGPFANVNWAMSLTRLLVGRDASVASIRSSSFDAPLTPTDFTIRDCSSKGTARLKPVKVDDKAIYVDKSGRRVYELAFSNDSGDYADRDLTRLNLDIGMQGFVDMAVQRQPDTRVHLVRGDGQAAVLVYDAADQVVAWYRIETDGDIENVCVLPGDQEDAVYYVIKRTINGATKRYVEKFAQITECIGSTVSKLADSHVNYAGVATTTISGLDHLEGEEVVVWGDGKDVGAYTVSGGAITGLTTAVTSATVGLSYEAKFLSAKLAYAAKLGTAINQSKRISQVGLVLLNTHYQGLEVGPDFDTMDQLPVIEEGTETPVDTIWSEYDAPMNAFNGTWKTDTRIALRATAPRPATVMAVSFNIQTNG